MSEHLSTNAVVEYRSLDFVADPGYRVGSDGSFWTTNDTRYYNYCKRDDLWRKLRTGTGSDGALIVNLRQKGKMKSFRSHRLVLLAFVGPCPEGRECCHWDGNPSNNSLSNLRWGTKSENARDKERHGTAPQGKNNPRAIINQEIADDIRKVYDEERPTHRQLSERFNVDVGLITIILRGRIWTYGGEFSTRDRGILGGSGRKGKDCHKCNSTPEQVIEARKLREQGLTYKEIGKKLGKSSSWVFGVVNRHSWKHI